MFELIDEFEEAIKRFLDKKGFGWLFFMVAIGFSVGKGILAILIKRENSKLETKHFSQPKTPLKRDLKKEKIILDSLDDELPISDVGTIKREEFRIAPILKNKNFAWFILLVSFFLMLIENFLKMDVLVGGWHIVSYLVLLLPLLYLIGKGELENAYTRLFVPFLFVFIVDMFYYNNHLVQEILPIIFMLVTIILYLTSMHKVHALYQTILPTLNLPFDEVFLMRKFFGNLWSIKGDKKLFKRIALALIITIPFLALFLILLLSADSGFGDFFEKAFVFDFTFNTTYIFTLPLYFFLYLNLFIYAVSNNNERLEIKESSPFDLLIVGIFLGMINLLFFLFIALQIPFLFTENYTPEGITIAQFAREGFFQLMMVMGIVLAIFIFIMQRFKGEKVLIFLLSSLLLSTIMMGVVSLKKIYLYQTLKGATVLRYYVEWFDYLLLLILALGMVFLFKKIKFEKLLDLIVLLTFSAFTLIVSLNIDAIVTAHNLEKFKERPELLDMKALEKLSIDALSVSLEKNIVYSDRFWFIEEDRASCKDFIHYHMGYCSKLELFENRKK